MRYRFDGKYTGLHVLANQNGNHGYYHTDMCTDEAIQFIETNRARPFFLYLCYVNPHSPLSVPELGEYADKPWRNDCRTYAAMISRLDSCVGRVMQTLKKEGLDENTVVFFCSDNGARSSGANRLTDVVKFFNSNGALKGYKRDMYEGGIRVPMIARWPGKIPAGKDSNLLWYFADFLPTTADIASHKIPGGLDGVSILPALLGEQQDSTDRFLYWEFFERGFQQAVRWRNWKAIRLKQGAPLELYDLSKDINETRDVAAKHPETVAIIEDYLKTARTDSPNWPLSKN